jgi:SAM-dependent methyltransferase
MSVDYNNFAKTFSNSRKNMKWEEIDYFLSFLKWKENLNILDIWCWNGRLLWELKSNKLNIEDYLGIDLSSELLIDAKKNHIDNEFRELDMLNINTLHNKYNVIFFIASFHHLDNINDRLEVLKKAYDLLDDNWIVFMTNWSLNSDLNKKRYKDVIIDWSENRFGSLDYNIKLWWNDRYYHSFNLNELKYLFKEVWFTIIENREFENMKNFISIIKKIKQ